MQIHATNILGLGASQVVKSFLDSASNMGKLNSLKIYLPLKGPLSSYKPATGSVIRYKRIFPNGFSRFFECFFSKFIFPNVPTIVLGDIPLRGIRDQIVLVHQPNLIYPRINRYSGKSLNFRISRFLFSINHKFAKKIIVQTGAMATNLILSYPKIKDKVTVCPQPVPNWLDKKNGDMNVVNDKKKKILFYPAAFYTHKKHDFLLKINDYCESNNIELNDVEVWLTLFDEEFKPFESIKWIKNLGRLNAEEMNTYYNKADALLFLSCAESYGLPLIEAITLNLPVLTVDLPYSRWICENEGYYYRPYSEASFLMSLKKLLNDLKLNMKPDYSKTITKFPDSWDEVVKVFFKSIKNY
ncbi:Glycosyltransferase involved in cell wall bisynthesis [Lutibacter agarilyticus]|uniref:Glycosyltransferase involved in cell wall bisynthesis n=1 Tax=Lutibacter agarilyticus TaxID=1109740 RepID=A0A238YVN0_9FLAO|nr:glycosyltransferase [Lutibacter agarilyticus]SNR74633.1 Glycosyltransferase involved in cell wall bisynthesis [Lutibacter agarilyticus]